MPDTKLCKPPLTVDQQRQLTDKVVIKYPVSETRQRRLDGINRALLIFLLSTGIKVHVLQESYLKSERHGKYAYDYPINKHQPYSTLEERRRISGSWSPAMREGDLPNYLYKLYGKTPQRYWQMLKAIGADCGIPTLCPLQLWGTHFTNRARLGVSKHKMAKDAQTAARVIKGYYMSGIAELNEFSESDRTYLKWLMGR